MDYLSTAPGAPTDVELLAGAFNNWVITSLGEHDLASAQSALASCRAHLAASHCRAVARSVANYREPSR